jgi:hypothetical protein
MSLAMSQRVVYPVGWTTMDHGEDPGGDGRTSLAGIFPEVGKYLDAGFPA